MKKLFLIAALTFGITSAFAEETPPATQQFHVQLVKIDTSYGAEVKVAPEDYPNGVYVRAKEVFGERPGTASVFAEKLRAHGFKVAEKAEDADAVFLIRSGSINFKEIDQNVGGVSAQKLDAATGVVIAAIATGGVSLLATDWSNFGNTKPVYTDLGVTIIAAKQKDKETALNGAIKADASNAKVTRAFFDLMSEEWFKAHVRTEAAATTAGSGVAQSTNAVNTTITKQ